MPWVWRLMTFEKHLRSVSRTAAQWLGIMRKSWQLLYYRSLLLQFFWCSALLVIEYCSIVWWSAANAHIKLLDRVVRSVCFLAGDVLECNLAHRWSVVVLCMQFKIKNNPMHHLNFYIAFAVCASVCYSKCFGCYLLTVVFLNIVWILCPFQYLLWNNQWPVFDGVGLAGFINRANTFLLA